MNTPDQAVAFRYDLRQYRKSLREDLARVRSTWHQRINDDADIQIEVIYNAVVRLEELMDKHNITY